MKQDFDTPGRYTLEIPVVPPEAMNLVVGMRNEHGQYFEDTVYVSVRLAVSKLIHHFFLHDSKLTHTTHPFFSAVLGSMSGSNTLSLRP